MRVDLSTAQVSLLVELLERAQSDLRDEIHKTDSAQWKQQIRDQETQMTELLRTLKGS